MSFTFEDGNTQAKVLTPTNAVELLAQIEDGYVCIGEDQYEHVNSGMVYTRRQIVERYMSDYNISIEE